MLINLSELFPVEGKSKTYTVSLEMTHFKGSDCSYKIVEKGRTGTDCDRKGCFKS